MRYTTFALALLVGAGSCAFDDGPARNIPVELRSQPPGPVVTDLGWEVTLDTARLFVHKVSFLTGEEGTAETGHTHSHLLSALTDETVPTGTIALAHGDHSASSSPAAGTKVGEIVTDAAFDLLASPHDAGRALFAIGAAAAEAHILVAPPEEGGPSEMHGGGLYLAGSAVPPDGGAAVAFEAILPVGAEAAVTGLTLHVDETTGIEIHVPRDGWFDGIDFAALPGGLIEDGSEAAEALEERLLHDTFHVHVLAD